MPKYIIINTHIYIQREISFQASNKEIDIRKKRQLELLLFSTPEGLWNEAQQTPPPQQQTLFAACRERRYVCTNERLVNNGAVDTSATQSRLHLDAVQVSRIGKVVGEAV